MRSFFYPLALTVTIISWSCTGQVKHENYTKHLLLDSRIIEETENVKLETGTVQKHHANPLFSEDRDWEKRFDNLYGNILFDEKENLFKCWYSPFIIDHSSKGLALEERQTNYGEAIPDNREMAICYATSKDGINWEKPDLGLVAYHGSKHNNIIWRGPHGAGIFRDMDEQDQAKRYKMIFKSEESGHYGLTVSHSADGIHWVEGIKTIGPQVAGDTHNNALWAPALHKYVGITRTWGEQGREVARIESEDFIHWTKEEVVMQGLEEDLQPYAMPTFYYGGVYLGLVAIHQQSTDRVWTELAWSSDSEIWNRIDAGNPLIPNSEIALDYDYGCAYACAYPVFKDDKIMLYYGGSDWLHTSWRVGFLCLATLRPDGFAGYVQQNEKQAGTIITKAVRYRGQDIHLTADVETGGSITATILDEKGNEIASAVSISSTVTNSSLTLNGKIREGHIKLKFEFNNAKLYSFEL